MKKLDIVFENRDLLVANKPSGLVVNRADSVRELTLQDLLSDYFGLGSGLGVGGRAGIVHRLDRETSGIIVIAKTEKVFLDLQKQFKERGVHKEYVALVHGNLESGLVKTKLGRVGSFGKFGVVPEGRESVSEYKQTAKYEFALPKFNEVVDTLQLNKQRIKYLQTHGKKYSLVSVFPKTGRTHQIRVHMKHIGNPVVSDSLYTPTKLYKFDILWCSRLFLHAKAISLRDPVSGKNLNFSVNLPNDLKGVTKFLEKI